MAPIPVSQGLVDFSQRSLWISLASILFNPKEHSSHFLTRLSGGRPRAACYALAITIFSLGLFRDSLYHAALEHQPSHYVLDYAEVKLIAVLLFVTGSTFVITSTYKLGIMGTYLGDYFGFLLDDRVTSFPFNVVEHPMYDGSTMCFLATALWKGKPAGVLLTAVVFAVYRIASTYFEGPFTTKIYAARDKRQNGGRRKAIEL